MSEVDEHPAETVERLERSYMAKTRWLGKGGRRAVGCLCHKPDGRQSIAYGEAWNERALPGCLLPIGGADHFTILDALARPEGVLTRALLAMLAGSGAAVLCAS